MLAREILVACEKPRTVRAVAAILAAAGTGARWDEISKILNEFEPAIATRVRTPRQQIDNNPATILSTPGNNRVNAGNNDLPLFTGSPQPKKVKPPKPDLRTSFEIVADEAVAMMRPRIEAKLDGMTWTTWLRRNRCVAADMARAGMSAEAISKAQERFGLLHLRYVQERLNGAASGKAAPQSSVHFKLEDPAERAKFEAEARARQLAKDPHAYDDVPLTEEEERAISQLGYTLARNDAAPKA